MEKSDSLERKSKRRHHQLTTVDSLSDLPNEILCKITSYLPTKNAIATQILSTKWKHISPFYASPPITLDVNDSSLLNPSSSIKYNEPSTSFANFMNKLVRTTLHGVCYEVLKLKCHKLYGDESISEWVFTESRSNFRELVLSILLDDSDGFFSLLSGLGLTKLNLGKSFSVRVPSGFVLPNVKVVVLFKLVFKSEYTDEEEEEEERNMFSDLFNGCPVLEDLCLSKCNFINNPCVIIKSDKLKKLTIKKSWIREHNYLRLKVTNLEVLVYDDWFRGKISSFESLLSAHLDVGVCDLQDDDACWFSESIVTSCSNTTSLSLATDALFALQRSKEELPIFQNLTCLSLGCLSKSEGWSLLAKLLCNAPNLETLTLEKGFGKHKRGYSKFLSVLPEPPICLDAHVKEIKFEEFNEKNDEIKLVEYFLNNGNVIENLQLCCLPFKKTSTESRLLMLPKYAKIDFQPR